MASAATQRGGMPLDPVAETHSPGQCSRTAESVVRQASDEAANPADDETRENGRDESIAGGFGNAGVFLADLDADAPAEQTTDDGLALQYQPRRRLEHGPLV